MGGSDEAALAGEFDGEARGGVADLGEVEGVLQSGEKALSMATGEGSGKQELHHSERDHR